jgi:hypothetical protein
VFTTIVGSFLSSPHGSSMWLSFLAREGSKVGQTKQLASHLTGLPWYMRTPARPPHGGSV